MKQTLVTLKTLNRKVYFDAQELRDEVGHSVLLFFIM